MAFDQIFGRIGRSGDWRAPIKRLSPADRERIFANRERRYYSTENVYRGSIGLAGPRQPYIYISLSASQSVKNFTRPDTQESPFRSARRDTDRINSFLNSSFGQLFTNRQIAIQKYNTYPETREYNKDSVLRTISNPLIKGPQQIRHDALGAGNAFDNALYSPSNIFLADNGPLLRGTATGYGGSLPFSGYAQKRGSAKYGLIRIETGNDAVERFNNLWGTSGGGGAWYFRPEYSGDQSSIYFKFLRDPSGLMKTTVNDRNIKLFYNDDSTTIPAKTTPSDFHKYTPGTTHTIQGANADDTINYYASDEKIIDDNVGADGFNLKTLHEKMVAALRPSPPTTQQFRKSAEGYIDDFDKGINADNNYKSIINATGRGAYVEFLRNSGEISVQVDELTPSSRGFAKASSTLHETGEPDMYNILPVLEEDSKSEMYLEEGSQQSKDLIFFYFYDIINKKYIPFRAVLGSIQDNHSPEWSDIKYMGRADTLYVYKGFARDVNFNFRVYANSIDELVPMWKRINYFAGLVRPSKYTSRALETNQETAVARAQVQNLLGNTLSDMVGDNILTTTGLESQFIYPPMIEFRIGDLYVDQPAILKSLSTSIPEDAHWETLRDDTYTYAYGISKLVSKEAYSRQLPTIVDISVQLSLLERTQSITSGIHFGPQAGWENTLT